MLGSTAVLPNRWTAPEAERESPAGCHGSARFYYSFYLVPSNGRRPAAYSKGAVGSSPGIYPAWSVDLDAGFTESMKKLVRQNPDSSIYIPDCANPA